MPDVASSDDGDERGQCDCFETASGPFGFAVEKQRLIALGCAKLSLRQNIDRTVLI